MWTPCHAVCAPTSHLPVPWGLFSISERRISRPGLPGMIVWFHRFVHGVSLSHSLIRYRARSRLRRHSPWVRSASWLGVGVGAGLGLGVVLGVGQGLR